MNLVRLPELNLTAEKKAIDTWSLRECMMQVL